MCGPSLETHLHLYPFVVMRKVCPVEKGLLSFSKLLILHETKEMTIMSRRLGRGIQGHMLRPDLHIVMEVLPHLQFFCHTRGAVEKVWRIAKKDLKGKSEHI